MVAGEGMWRERCEGGVRERCEGEVCEREAREVFKKVAMLSSTSFIHFAHNGCKGSMHVAMFHRGRGQGRGQ